MEDICKEGKVRYEKKIPPGYKDNTNKSNGNEYGDLIVWKEIIKYAKTNKQPIVFVTDDQKEDWWTIEKGFSIRPREELIKEFLDETGIRILIYNADRFLRAAKRRKLVESIDPKSLDEVLNFSKSKISEVDLEDINHFKPQYDARLVYDDLLSNMIKKDWNSHQYKDGTKYFDDIFSSYHISELKKNEIETYKEMIENLIKRKRKDDNDLDENFVEV